MATEPWAQPAEMAKLVAALQQATEFFHEAAAKVPPGIIALKDAPAATSGKGGRSV